MPRFDTFLCAYPFLASNVVSLVAYRSDGLIWFSGFLTGLSILFIGLAGVVGSHDDVKELRCWEPDPRKRPASPLKILEPSATAP
jgi:hypothetical protein